jgi:hypothetical protein
MKAEVGMVDYINNILIGDLKDRIIVLWVHAHKDQEIKVCQIMHHRDQICQNNLPLNLRLLPRVKVLNQVNLVLKSLSYILVSLKLTLLKSMWTVGKYSDYWWHLGAVELDIRSH